MLRILFVDDEPAILDSFRRRLYSMRSEWHMEFLQSAHAALERMKVASCDVVVSDMRMTGMDGAQLFCEVPRLYPQTVRILLSGMASEEAMERAMATTNHIISKPCDIEELKVLIVKAVGMVQSTSAPRAFSALEKRIRQECAATAHSLQPLEEHRSAINIAHDLNNLLMVIHCCADLICEEQESDSLLRELSSEIIQVAERAVPLIKELSAFRSQ